jgi:hypothetical protein
MKMPGKVTCKKLHYSTETVGNLTRTLIEAHLKMENGSEKIIQGRGQPVFPKFPSSTAMAWKSSDHDKWHGEHTVSLEVPFGKQLFEILTKEWNGHVEILV